MKNYNNKNIAQAIWEIMSGKSGHDLEDASKKVALFLARKRLLSKANNILSLVKKIEDESNGVMNVILKSATLVAPNVQKDIAGFLKTKYKKEKIIIEEKIIPNTLGGFRVEIGDEVIDMTLRRRLANLQAELSR